MKPTATSISLWTCTLAGAATLAVMVYASRPGDLESGLMLLAFMPWAIAPYCGLAALALKRRSSVEKSRIVAVAALIVAGLGACLLTDAFVIRLDPQSGLVFLVLPPLQWLGVGIAAILPAESWFKI
jgi:hypothetical protein